MSDSPIRAYLAELRRGLPWHLRGRRRIITELADHLDHAAAAARAGGAGEEEAEQRAVEQVGPAARLAADLRASTPGRPRLAIVAVAGGVVCAAVLAGIAIRSSSPRAGGPAAIPVSFLRPARTSIPILGGTPALRARARAVLRGMGHSDIVEVEFATSDGPQLRGPMRTGTVPWVPPPRLLRWPAVAGRHPAALVITIGWNGTERSLIGPSGRDPFFPAYVFAAGFFERSPAGSSGIGELGIDVRYGSGATGVWMARPLGRPPRTPAAPASGQVVRTIARAADRAGLRVLRITLSRSSRLVVSVALKAARTRGLGGAVTTFSDQTAALSAGLGGFRWVVSDGCGTVLAANSSVWMENAGYSYANPHVLCPNPLGFGGDPEQSWCRRQLAHPVAC